MKKKTFIKVVSLFYVEIDDKHPHFKSWMEGFNKSISKDANVADAAKSLAYQFASRSIDGDFFEGFGVVNVNGKKPTTLKEPTYYTGDFININIEFENELEEA